MTGLSRDIGAAPFVPFLARERELAWLEEHWQAAVRGTGRVVLVVGEPGMGKSRLVHEFGASLSARGYRTFTLVCRRPNALTPLQPFGALMGTVPDDPEMALAWLEACAGIGPTLFVVEDAHWADPSTVEVIGRAGALEVPLLLVLTSRPEPVPGAQSQVPPARRMHLEPLSPADARRMVELVLGEDLRTGVVDDLVFRADGVPLYLEELARHATAHGPLDPDVIPDTLNEVIASRLDRLGDSMLVAQMASVVGREFEIETVRALCATGDGGIEEHLWRLAEHAVVNLPPPAPVRTMSFRHALIRQAAYASLDRATRRRAHSIVADMLLASERAGAEPQIAAYHLTEAERFGEAVAMWRAAARAARRHARFNEAAGHERKVLALLPDLEESHRDSVELKARSRLAMCLTAVDQGAPEILEHALRAQELSRVYGDQRTLLDTYLILLPYWQARADYRSIDAALPEIRQLTRRADPGYAHGLSTVEACVRIWQGSLADGLGQLGEMFERGGIPLRESLRSLPPLSPPTVLMRSSSRVAAALGCWLTGDARSAWRLVDDTLLFASERAVPAAHAVASATAALIAQLEGDRPRVADLAAQAERAPAETATLQWRSWGAALRRWADGGPAGGDIPGPMLRPYFLMLCADGDAVAPADAVRMMDEALAMVAATGERFCEAELLRIRGRARQRQGDTDGAVDDLRQAVAVARSQLARALELKALTDLLAVAGDTSTRGRLQQLLSSLRLDGPQLAVGEAARALGS